METRLRDLLRELERVGAANDAVESDRARKMLNLESETAGLLAILARSSGATRVLEIGTSNGYSTVWLAWAVAPSGGRVTSIDRDAKKHATARDNLIRAGFQDRVELCLGEATAIARELSGPIRSRVLRRGPHQRSRTIASSPAETGATGAAHRRQCAIAPPRDSGLSRCSVGAAWV